jgi:D-serine deaminase-like pyridoxal phosphate-dependent protein
MIDHEDQLASIEAFRAKEDKKKPWEIFIKVDCGYHRAGIPPESPRMKTLILRAERSAAVSIHGFYCHGGHSYHSQTPDSAAAVLQQEVGEALKAAEMMTKKTAIVISFGATPTAHVVKTLHKALPTHMALELHAGRAYRS